MGVDGLLSLLPLPNVEPLDPAGRRKLKLEVGPEIAPPVRVEFSKQIESVVLHTFDGGEPFVTHGVTGKRPLGSSSAVRRF
jgi:hypothetical protein